jgi:hypothetical protein
LPCPAVPLTCPGLLVALHRAVFDKKMRRSLAAPAHPFFTRVMRD